MISRYTKRSSNNSSNAIPNESRLKMRNTFDQRNSIDNPSNDNNYLSSLTPNRNISNKGVRRNIGMRSNNNDQSGNINSKTSQGIQNILKSNENQLLRLSRFVDESQLPKKGLIENTGKSYENGSTVSKIRNMEETIKKFDEFIERQKIKDVINEMNDYGNLKTPQNFPLPKIDEISPENKFSSDYLLKGKNQNTADMEDYLEKRKLKLKNVKYLADYCEKTQNYCSEKITGIEREIKETFKKFDLKIEEAEDKATKGLKDLKNKDLGIILEKLKNLSLQVDEYQGIKDSYKLISSEIQLLNKKVKSSEESINIIQKEMANYIEIQSLRASSNNYDEVNSGNSLNEKQLGLEQEVQEIKQNMSENQKEIKFENEKIKQDLDHEIKDIKDILSNLRKSQTVNLQDNPLKNNSNKNENEGKLGESTKISNGDIPQFEDQIRSLQGIFKNSEATFSSLIIQLNKQDKEINELLKFRENCEKNFEVIKDFEPRVNSTIESLTNNLDFVMKEMNKNEFKTIDKLSTRIDEFEKQYNANIINELSTEIEKLKNTCEILNANQKQHEKEIRDNKKDARASEEHSSKINQVLDEAISHLNKEVTNTYQFNDVAIKLRKEFEELQELQERMDNEHKIIQNEVNDLIKFRNDYKDDKKQVQSESNKQKQLNSQINETKEGLEEFEKRFEKEIDRFKGMQSQIKSMKAEIEDFKNNFDGKRGDSYNLNSEVSKLKYAADDFKSKFELFQNEIDEIKNDKFSALSNSLNNLKSIYTNHENQLKRIENTLFNKDKEDCSVFENFNEKLQVVNNEIDSLFKLDAKCLKMEETIKGQESLFEKKLMKIKSDFEEMNNKSESEKKKELQELILKSNEKLNQQIQQIVITKINELQAKFDNLQALVDGLKNEYNVMIKNIENLTNNLENKINEFANINESFKNYDQNVANLNSSFGTLSSKCNEIESKMGSLLDLDIKSKLNSILNLNLNLKKNFEEIPLINDKVSILQKEFTHYKEFVEISLKKIDKEKEIRDLYEKKLSVIEFNNFYVKIQKQMQALQKSRI